MNSETSKSINKIARILIVGYGSIAKRHLSIVKEMIAHIEVGVLSNRGLKIDIDQVRTFTNIEQAISFEPDMAIVCNPSSSHVDIALDLAEAGIHMLIEKPVSNSLLGLDELLEYAEKDKLKIGVGYNLRFNSSLLQFKKVIDQGDYGRVLSVSAEVGQYLPDWRPGADYRKSVSANRSLGGGALLELSHELDYLIWLFGYPKSVFAQIMRVSELEIDVEDLVEALLTMEGLNGNFPIRVHMDFLQRNTTRECKVVCENGTLVWRAVEGTVEVWQQNQKVEEYNHDSERNDTYRAEQLDMYNAITCNQSPAIPLEEGIAVIKLVEALRASALMKKVVVL